MELKKVLEQNKDQYIKHLMDLIAIDTQVLGHGIDGGREKKGQEYLESLLLDMGAEVKKGPMKEENIKKFYDLYQEGNLGHNQEDRWNLYGKFTGNPENKSLMFNGHVDVMPTGNLDEWDTPPFEPTIIDGKIYGRGSADMKSGLMASIMAVKLLQDAKVDLPGDVIITSVVDEEGGGNGSMQAVLDGQRADGVVVCECTGDELILAHMGFIFFRVEVEGKSVHSGTKIDGVSAIDKCIKIINELNELEHNWLLKYKHPLLPAPNLNVGVIKGGNAGSTVAGDCYFESCVHYLPKIMSREQVIKEFNRAVENVCKGDEWLSQHKPKVTIYQAGGGFEMDLDHEFVKSFERAYSNSRDKEVKIVGSPAGCDSRLWRNIAKMPTIQFGPGDLSQAHAINEYVSIDDYLNAILIYANLILEYCN